MAIAAGIVENARILWNFEEKPIAFRDLENNTLLHLAVDGGWHNLRELATIRSFSFHFTVTENTLPPPPH